MFMQVSTYPHTTGQHVPTHKTYIIMDRFIRMEGEIHIYNKPCEKLEWNLAQIVRLKANIAYSFQERKKPHFVVNDF